MLVAGGVCYGECWWIDGSGRFSGDIQATSFVAAMVSSLSFPALRPPRKSPDSGVVRGGAVFMVVYAVWQAGWAFMLGLE